MRCDENGICAMLIKEKYNIFNKNSENRCLLRCAFYINWVWWVWYHIPFWVWHHFTHSNTVLYAYLSCMWSNSFISIHIFWFINIQHYYWFFSLITMTVFTVCYSNFHPVQIHCTSSTLNSATSQHVSYFNVFITICDKRNYRFPGSILVGVSWLLTVLSQSHWAVKLKMSWH